MIAIAPLIPERLRQQVMACVTEDNWDDDGAVGITQSQCNVAIDFINRILNEDKSIPLLKSLRPYLAQ